MRLSLFIVAAATAVAFASPARAIDCAAAKSDIDKAICAAPALKAADDSMAAAWKSAHDAASGADRDALLVSQRNWIKRRGAGCDSGEPNYLACMIDDTNARRAYLEARPEGGPGTGSPLQPALVMRAGRKGAYEVDVELLKFAGPAAPGEKTFNAAVAKAIAEIPKTAEGLDADQTGAYDLDMRVTWASPKLISARVDGYDFSGGAHGNPYSYGINIDTASGRKLAFADAFDAAAHGKLDTECYAQVSKDRKKRLGDQAAAELDKEARATLHKDVGDLANWNFSGKGATISFGTYELGSYAEGAYACDLPLARLKELTKPGFPLPE